MRAYILENKTQDISHIPLNSLVAYKKCMFIKNSWEQTKWDDGYDYYCFDEKEETNPRNPIDSEPVSMSEAEVIRFEVRGAFTLDRGASLTEINFWDVAGEKIPLKKDQFEDIVLGDGSAVDWSDQSWGLSNMINEQTEYTDDEQGQYTTTLFNRGIENRTVSSFFDVRLDPEVMSTLNNITLNIGSPTGRVPQVVNIWAIQNKGDKLEKRTLIFQKKFDLALDSRPAFKTTASQRISGDKPCYDLSHNGVNSDGIYMVIDESTGKMKSVYCEFPEIFKAIPKSNPDYEPFMNNLCKANPKSLILYENENGKFSNITIEEYFRLMDWVCTTTGCYGSNSHFKDCVTKLCAAKKRDPKTKVEWVDQNGTKQESLVTDYLKALNATCDSSEQDIVIPSKTDFTSFISELENSETSSGENHITVINPLDGEKMKLTPDEYKRYMLSQKPVSFENLSFDIFENNGSGKIWTKSINADSVMVEIADTRGNILGRNIPEILSDGTISINFDAGTFDTEKDYVATFYGKNKKGYKNTSKVWSAYFGFPEKETEENELNIQINEFEIKESNLKGSLNGTHTNLDYIQIDIANNKTGETVYNWKANINSGTSWSADISEITFSPDTSYTARASAPVLEQAVVMDEKSTITPIPRPTIESVSPIKVSNPKEYSFFAPSDMNLDLNQLYIYDSMNSLNWNFEEIFEEVPVMVNGEPVLKDGKQVRETVRKIKITLDSVAPNSNYFTFGKNEISLSDGNKTYDFTLYMDEGKPSIEEPFLFEGYYNRKVKKAGSFTTIPDEWGDVDLVKRLDWDTKKFVFNYYSIPDIQVSENSDRISYEMEPKGADWGQIWFTHDIDITEIPDGDVWTENIKIGNRQEELIIKVKISKHLYTKELLNRKTYYNEGWQIEDSNVMNIPLYGMTDKPKILDKKQYAKYRGTFNDTDHWINGTKLYTSKNEIPDTNGLQYWNIKSNTWDDVYHTRTWYVVDPYFNHKNFSKGEIERDEIQTHAIDIKSQSKFRCSLPKKFTIDKYRFHNSKNNWSWDYDPCKDTDFILSRYNSGLDINVENDSLLGIVNAGRCNKFNYNAYIVRHGTEKVPMNFRFDTTDSKYSGLGETTVTISDELKEESYQIEVIQFLDVGVVWNKSEKKYLIKNQIAGQDFEIDLYHPWDNNWDNVMGWFENNNNGNIVIDKEGQKAIIKTNRVGQYPVFLSDGKRKTRLDLDMQFGENFHPEYNEYQLMNNNLEEQSMNIYNISGSLELISNTSNTVSARIEGNKLFFQTDGTLDTAELKIRETKDTGNIEKTVKIIVLDHKKWVDPQYNIGGEWEPYEERFLEIPIPDGFQVSDFKGNGSLEYIDSDNSGNPDIVKVVVDQGGQSWLEFIDSEGYRLSTIIDSGISLWHINTNKVIFEKLDSGE